MIGKPEPEPQGWLSIFNCLSNEKSYAKAAISFAVAGLLLLLCTVTLFTIVLAPAKFVMLFTFCMFSVLTGLAFLNGPRIYMKKLFIQKNLIASLVLLGSIAMSLYFSLIAPSYLMSLIFCCIQLNAILYFFCSTSAVNMTTLKWIGQGIWQTVCFRRWLIIK